MTKKKIDLELLEKLYKTQKFGTRALAELFGVSIRTIQVKLNQIGVDLVKNSDKPRDKFGRLIIKGKDYEPLTKENNGNYKGGISLYRKIAFEENELEKICYHCNKTEEETRIVIHHIDRNRYNNEISNLRPVCNSCHMKHEHPDSIEKARIARAEKLKAKREEEENKRREA